MNRLKLDFSLNSIEERNLFLQSYLEEPQFKKNPPSPEELETLSNYILWGKETGLEKDGHARIKDEGLYIETRSKDWTDDRAVSLEGLLETPGFSENEFKKMKESHSKMLTLGNLILRADTAATVAIASVLYELEI